MNHTFISMLFFMLVGHAIADYPLQGDFLAKLKDRKSPVAAMMGPYSWLHGLGWHAMIHAGFVGFVTGSVTLGVCEFIVHAVTDFSKTEGKIGLNTDQGIHVACKVLWAGIAAIYIYPWYA